MGDSRAVLGERRGKRIVAYSLSVDHTPYRKDERERLKQKGAVIQSETMAKAGGGGKRSNESWEEDIDKAEFMQRMSTTQRRSILDPNARSSLLGLTGAARGGTLGDPSDVIKNGWGVDPPRVYQKGSTRPGMKVTRSLGDDIWEARIGINAEAEVLRKTIVETDQFVMVATDGLWEFVSNQAVCEMVLQFGDPIDACHAVLAEAYSLWLQFEVQTDDITMILAYIDAPEGPAPRKAPDAELARFAEIERSGRRLSTLPMSMSPGSLSWSRQTMCFDDALREGARPVRRNLSPAKRAQLAITSLDPPAAAEVDSTAAASPAPSMADVGLDGIEGAGALDHNLEIGQPKVRRESLVPEVPKADEENARIIACLSGHFLFERLSMDKIQQLASAMRRRTTAEDEIVFSQGEMGTTLYVLEDGEYVASVEKDGRSMDLFTYEPNEPHGANPCFGELGVMHVGQREHTVTSLGEGVLWELDRRTFQKVVLFSSRAALLNTLRTVEVFCSLPIASMERLADLLVEVTYQPGETVVRQGEEGTAFYVIAHGRCKVTRSSTLSWEQLLGEYGPGDYFGERALLESEPRAATVAALGPSPLRVLTVSRAAFDDAIGSLQVAIDEYASWQRKVAGAKEFERNAAGLFGVRVTDFAYEGVATKSAPFVYVLCTLGARSFTLKCAYKLELLEQRAIERVRREVELLNCVMHHRRFIPLPLATLEEDQCIFSVLPVRLTLSLAEVLEQSKGTLDERSALFYTASIVLALEHLQQEHLLYAGGIVYRNFATENLFLDEHGYVQLTDFRFATKAEPPPCDYCGYAHALAPEQVAGGGHGVAADFWALGVLLYELTTGSNPWLTEEDDTEVDIYARISAHVSEMLPLPDAVTLSAFVVKLLNELFEPLPGARLGARDPGGIAELKAHPAFERINWRDLGDGVAHAPHLSLVRQHLDQIQQGTPLKEDGHSLHDLFPAWDPTALMLPKDAMERVVEETAKSPHELVESIKRSTRSDPTYVEEGGKHDTDATLHEGEKVDTLSDLAPTSRMPPDERSSNDVVQDTFRGFMDGFAQVSHRFFAPAVATVADRTRAQDDGAAYGNAFSRRESAPATTNGGRELPAMPSSNTD